MRDNPFEINEDIVLNIWAAEFFAGSGYFTLEEALKEMEVPVEVYEKYLMDKNERRINN